MDISGLHPSSSFDHLLNILAKETVKDRERHTVVVFHHKMPFFFSQEKEFSIWEDKQRIPKQGLLIPKRCLEGENKEIVGWAHCGTWHPSQSDPDSKLKGSPKKYAIPIPESWDAIFGIHFYCWIPKRWPEEAVDETKLNLLNVTQ